MAISVTNIGTNTVSAGNNVSVTLGAGGISAGSLIVVLVADSSTTASAGSCAVTDTRGNTYINGLGAGSLNSIGASNANGGTIFFYCYNATALVNGDTITYTLQQTGRRRIRHRGPRRTRRTGPLPQLARRGMV